nr:hypothetical protein CFP56_27715 [Quercus suber]
MLVEVQGFENVGTNQPIPRQTKERVLAHHMDMTARLKVDGVETKEIGDGVTEAQPAPMSIEVSSSGKAQRVSHVHGTDIGGPHTKIQDFEAINAEPAVLKSNILNPDPYLVISGKERNIGVMVVQGNSGISIKVIGKGNS